MSEDRKMNLRDEMETMLPFYLNGTLSGDDLRRVEDWIANDPDSAEALIAAEGELAFISEENQKLRPHPYSFRRFSDSLAKEGMPAVSLASQLSAWLRKTFAAPGPLIWVSAAATLALLVIATTSINRTHLDDIQIAGMGQGEEAAFTLVVFKADAPLGAIASLLAAAGGQIVSGPGSRGAFKVALSASTISNYDAALAALAKSPLVEQVIAGRKPDEVK